MIEEEEEEEEEDSQEAHPSHGLKSTFLHKFKFKTSTLTYPKLG
jgi:hypothetical protein